MNKTMKIRAAAKGDGADIKILMSHPMETGQRKDPQTGDVVPAHFIKTVEASVGGNVVLRSQWGAGIAKNPYLAFRVKGAKSGDSLTVTWVDNIGETGHAEAQVR